MKLIVLLLFPASVAFAGPPEALVSSSAVADALNGAREQVLLLSPSVSNREVAEALRRAAVERDVKVFMVVSPEHVEEGGSFVASLAALDNVRVRLAVVDRAFALVDAAGAAFVIEGGALSEGGGQFDAQEGYATRDSDVIADRGGLFNDVWGVAPAYRSLVERAPFEMIPFGGTP